MPRLQSRNVPSNSESRPPRLQKVLAQAGYGSRRSCEELIVSGRVEVDRQPVFELGVRVDPEKQSIRVDGEPVRVAQKQYYALHKPVGVVTTNRDPAGRMRVIDLVPDGDQMFAVGRLDKTSSGLIIITNDGDFANRLAHPRYGVHKTYRVTVMGHPDRDTLHKLRNGIYLAEGPVRVVAARVKSRTKQHTILQIVLADGRNREIRRMLASVGHKVLTLQRTAIGSLQLDDLPEGAYRPLTPREIRSLTTHRAGRGSTGKGRRRPASRDSNPNSPKHPRASSSKNARRSHNKRR